MDLHYFTKANIFTRSARVGDEKSLRTPTHVAGVPALRACADGGAGQVVGGAELRLQREVARVVAPQRHLDLLQHQRVLGGCIRKRERSVRIEMDGLIRISLKDIAKKGRAKYHTAMSE